MIKGINKKMIVVKNTGSKYFEEAHFIVKASISEPTERDLLKEATQIVGKLLSESGKVSKPKGTILKKLLTLILSFFSGALIGISLCLLF